MTVRGVFSNATERRSLERGEVLFAEGDHGAEMFGVVTGLIELMHGADFVEALGPGQTFGEMAIIDQSPRSLTAIASASSEVAVINRRTFLYLVHETPEFALQVMHTLTDRIRRHGFSD